MSKRISVLATLLLFIGGISIQAADKMFTAARSSRSSAVRRHGRSRRARSITTLTDDAGATVQITDLAPRFKHYGRLFQPTVLVRRVVPLAGSPRLRIRVRPRSDYGAAPMTQ